MIIFADLEPLVFDPSEMTVLSSPSGAQCALDTTCIGGWHINIDSAWFDINFGMLHYITTVYINILSGALFWNNTDFEFKTHNDQPWKTLGDDMVKSFFI